MFGVGSHGGRRMEKNECKKKGRKEEKLNSMRRNAIDRVFEIYIEVSEHNLTSYCVD